ncbi:MAG: GDP-mannose 4,6-dehydratase [Aminobacterium sp.]|uniref:GDP-mannose 4,6-dehydratase n=1 Tax=Aminobacterium sp. TaxID=1872491 RepID=UPI001BCC8A36|nr:GDP-mannose 4,6-dehydratase [Aminobacterium sp.]MDD2206103.1 GDP-mannose 4,6-dehydratase [Aminobacterium sp.]MDD3707822.1 GDP-mannose 4,6-dehydratase [Aminobacterium sp.]MDD4228053.1 GDP-mannose 4,6-dehydratase [Aminobacterium sp.]MDD4551100.1 GDP-mannose 4,6-dehydratase [Aminobacterium sp.]MEA4876748.1 GDP-mannose 4,6-dehydratase [Aminobacterium sp.]
MSLKVFITGIGGFIGSHLSEFLARKGCEVWGSYFRPTNDMSVPTRYAKGLFNIDVRQRSHLEEALQQVRPHVIYHLAAQSYPMVSYKEPEFTVESNVMGTLNVFESMLHLGLKDTRVLLASSTAAYGFIDPSEAPVTEDQPFRPAHVYGMSKAAQDLLAVTYGNAHSLDIIRLRIGNCVGRRRRGEVVSDFTRRRAQIDLGIIPPEFHVGNLHTKRAFLDVRDAVEGFWALQEKGRGGEAYNISGSDVVSMQQLLDIVLEGCEKDVNVVRDPALVRAVDELIYWNDLSKIEKDTGWKPCHVLSDTVNDMVEWWREELKKSEKEGGNQI